MDKGTVFRFIKQLFDLIDFSVFLNVLKKFLYYLTKLKSY